jgi:hypothetical protein
MTIRVPTQEEYKDICAEIAQLKHEQKDLNLRLNNDRSYWQSFSSEIEGALARIKAESRAEEIRSRLEYLRGLASAWVQASQGKRKERRTSFSTNGITKAIANAYEAIERLYEQQGDMWKYDDRALCADLRFLVKQLQGDRVIGGWKSPQGVEDIQQQHWLQLAKMQKQIDAAKQEITQLRDVRGAAQQVVDELWEAQYEEREDYRLRRGYTHRIHLNEELRKKMREAMR